MECTPHGVSLKSKENVSPGRKGRTQRSPDREKTLPKEDSEPIRRALDRFSSSPPPTGIPESIDPPPMKIEIDWQVKGVSKSVQDKVGVHALPSTIPSPTTPGTFSLCCEALGKREGAEATAGLRSGRPPNILRAGSLPVLEHHYPTSRLRCTVHNQMDLFFF